MGQSQFKLIAYISFLAAFVAILITLYINFYYKYELKRVIISLEKLEKEFQSKEIFYEIPRVAIGFGGCTDYLAKAINILKNTGIPEPKSKDILLKAFDKEINSIDDLNLVFSKFFIKGAAAERYIHNSSLFYELVRNVKTDVSAASFAGGNAVVMGNRMALEGANVLLGAKLSDVQSKFLHSNVSFVMKSLDNEHEDIHIILEYDVGDKWGLLESPRANRFIVHRDENTPYLKGIEEMEKQIVNFQPHLFVLGGLQMLDDFPFVQKSDQEDQIKKLENFISGLTKSYPIHFEMASFVDKNLLIMLKNHIIPFSDSLGFNEQELPNLLSVLKYDEITHLSTAYPRTSQMLDDMRQVWSILVDRQLDLFHHKLSRLHLHTIGYQIIMTDIKSPFWYSSRSSVAKVSLSVFVESIWI